ncbi:MAG: YggS family pyridoxal phosphate-dependent enzyme [Luteolibacter sp.]|jgi:PLP dependent protein
MSDLQENLASIRRKMASACRDAGRVPGDVELVAVTKTFPADAVSEAYRAGQRIFGESRLQEALPKMELLPGDIQWHFIGRVQRNKLRKILAVFDFVHGIDSADLAEAADRIAGELGLFPKVFLQVNIANEETKGGFTPSALEDAMPALLALPRLEIQGLMAIPPPADTPDDARKWFSALRDLRDRLEVANGVRLPGLSMGMSDDFEAAIAEGATLVRVGSAIFGNRSANP